MSIQVRNLNKSYGSLRVINNWSGTFKDGQIYCIKGDSGSGKTTLLRILMGLEKADGGDISGLRNRKISVVFQEDRLLENNDIYTNIAIVENSDFAGQDPKEYVRKACESIGLQDCNDKPVRELSGGMKRRVAILRALSTDYDILLLDEPFKGLDHENRKKVMDYVKMQTKDKTVILVTHDEYEADYMGCIVYSISSPL